eukprot:Lithocolla_globosa_v1_NODE_737_length_3362_cov_14.232235.p2 type:complete len:118 gc:universal NODE_737_length_3362_cov_14.232235:788-1141(+)
MDLQTPYQSKKSTPRGEGSSLQERETRQNRLQERFRWKDDWSEVYVGNSLFLIRKGLVFPRKVYYFLDHPYFSETLTRQNRQLMRPFGEALPSHEHFLLPCLPKRDKSPTLKQDYAP